MTIETQVAALVTATNDLTETFTHKVDQVDAAVVSMQNQMAALPKTLLGKYTIVVDQVSGDNTAADQDGAVVRTIDEAFRRAKPFQANLIALASNQTHTFDNSLNITFDGEVLGLETGYIYIYDRDQSSNGVGQPTAYSPVLNWSAVLITSFNMIFGGSNAAITINHTDGCINSMNPRAILGTGWSQCHMSLSHSVVSLDCAQISYPLFNTMGSVQMQSCVVKKNAPNARLSGDAPVTFKQSGSSFSGSANPRSWDDLLGMRTSLTLEEVTNALSPSVTVLFVDTVTGSDLNDGRSAATALASVDEAIERATPGKSWEIRLTCGQTFTISNNHVDSTAYSGSAGYIWFRDSAGGALNTVTPSTDSPTLIIEATLRMARQLFFGGYDCPLKIIFHGPMGRLAPMTDDSGPDQGHMTGTMRVSFSHSQITLDTQGGTTTWHAVQTDNFIVSLRACDVIQVDSYANLIGRNGYGTIGSFHCTSSTFGGVATQWADLFDEVIRPTGGGAPLGILSNVEL